MPIIARCDGCRRKFNCPDNLAGRRVKCKHCKHPFVVPAAATATAATAVLPETVIPKKVKAGSAPAKLVTPPVAAPPLAVAAARSMGALESTMTVGHAASPTVHRPYFRTRMSTHAPKFWLGGIVGVVGLMVGGAVYMARSGDISGMPWFGSSPTVNPTPSVFSSGSGRSTTAPAPIATAKRTEIWDVQPDPQKGTAPAGIPALFQMPLDWVGNNDLISMYCPRGQSPFVVLHDQGSKDSWRSIDLSNKSVAGTISIPDLQSIDRVAVTPDGKLLAVATGGYVPGVQIWSFATGQRIGRMDETFGEGGVAGLDFASPDQLVVSWRTDRQTIRVVVVDPNSGKTVRILYDGQSTNPDPNAIAVSPAGRYVAVAACDAPARTRAPLTLMLIETATGKTCGWRAFAPPTETAQAVSFSPDGNQIVVGSDQGGGTRLFIYDLADGNPSSSWTIPGVGVGGANSLQWLPGDFGWWVDQSMVYDRRRQQVVAKADGSRLADGILLYDGRVLVIDHRNVNPVLRSTALPYDQISSPNQDGQPPIKLRAADLKPA